MEFGTSGWLFQSNKLMYDRGTNTLWHQFLGKPVVGELVGSGITLEVLPMTLTIWADWLASHPNTTVLDVETGVYPNLFVGFDTGKREFLGITELESGGGSVRHMFFHQPSAAVWFGTDANTIGRARLP